MAEAEAMAGAPLADNRRLADELAALRGGQAAGGAAAAEAADLRRQLDQTRCPSFMTIRFAALMQSLAVACY